MAYTGASLPPPMQRTGSKGILKSPKSTKRVIWSDRTVPVNNDNLTKQAQKPVNVINEAKPMTYQNSYVHAYKPAVIPSSKKVFRFGTNCFVVNNDADPIVVQQLGGITSTIDRMQRSLKIHELRPYEYCEPEYDPIIEQQYATALEIDQKLFDPNLRKNFQSLINPNFYSSLKSC